jgi:hypothetical protein
MNFFGPKVDDRADDPDLIRRTAEKLLGSGALDPNKK